MKSPRKQATKDTQQTKQRKIKGKEKMDDEQRKKEPRKILPRKSTRATRSSPGIDMPILNQKDDALAQDNPTTKKEKS